MMKKLIPSYSVIPYLLCAGLHMFTYYGARLINHLIHGSTEGFFDLSLSIDSIIPVIPVWTYIYVLSYVFWVVCYVAAGREGKEFLGRIIAADLVCKIITFTVFIVMPTTAPRPEMVENGIGAWLLELIYSADVPDNLFPSMHCSVSWLSFRFLSKAKSIPAIWKWASFVFAVLVFASVVFTKQHIVLDIVSGVIVAEIGVQVGFRTSLFKIFSKLHISILRDGKK